MDKLPLTGRNPNRVFNSRSGRVHFLQLHFSETEQANLKLKTWPKQHLGSLPLVIVLSVVGDGQMSRRAFFNVKCIFVTNNALKSTNMAPWLQVDLPLGPQGDPNQKARGCQLS